MSLLLTIVLWFLAFVACAIVSLIIYATWNYGKLDGLGFPVIPPYLFLGSNYMEPYRVQTELSVERQNKYGKIYGAYDGRTPVIYISDPKILRLIRTVDSDYFRNHAFNFGNDPLMMELLDLLKDEKWKTVRAALTPIFTTGKIKQMSKIIRDFGDDYAKDLEKSCKNGKIEFNMKEYSPPLIIECIAKSFCGIEIPNGRDPNNPFITNMKAALFDHIGSEDWMSNIFKIFPFTLSWMTSLTPSGSGMEFFLSVIKSSMESRLQALKGESNDAASSLAEMIRKVRQADPTYKSLGITETTVLSQAWEFFLASYLSIRDALTGLSYELARHPEIQEKIYEECKGKEEESGESSTPFTTACVSEILRLYPAFDKPERLCNRTWKHEETGITIPKGIQVVFPMSAVHYNPEYFPDPMTFKPERFLEKVDPNLIMTFGQGPRACIGSRMGMELIRILIISFVSKFKFVPRPDTEYVKSTGPNFTVPVKPVYVDLILRN